MKVINAGFDQFQQNRFFFLIQVKSDHKALLSKQKLPDKSDSPEMTGGGMSRQQRFV